jgi:beta-lactamase regulating signal transducer with metallopeptidase domain
MVKAKPHNKTEDLILKIKEVMGFLDRDNVAKAYKSYTARIEAVVPLTAILLNVWILNLFICNFYFILTKSDDFQRCCDSL